MKQIIQPWLILAASIIMFGLEAQSIQSKDDNTLFIENVFYLSEVMLHDVANPPAASRFYAYSILGAYEVVLSMDVSLVNLNNRFTKSLIFSSPKKPKNVHVVFAAIYSMLDVGKQIMPSGNRLAKEQEKLVEYYTKEKGIAGHVLKSNIRYAQEIASQVVAYARTDGYNKLSTYNRYVPKKLEGHWYPTPPEYMGAVEPQWKTIRPFFLDSPSQFAPLPPSPFSRDENSSFMKQMHEVYKVSKELTNEQKAIANFWDCNPFAVEYAGHMAIGLKKISPGGHWIGITGIAAIQAQLPVVETIFVHTMVALTLHDAFISCWQEKYNSDRIRPESAINKNLDPVWKPLLQTPPFPEYTSGHSVASASASVVLTHFFGDNFQYTDTSEQLFGLPNRSFTSFYQAADEAAISRLYGGIHFRDACEEGVKQGKKVGNHVLSKIK